MIPGLVYLNGGSALTAGWALFPTGLAAVCGKTKENCECL